MNTPNHTNTVADVDSAIAQARSGAKAKIAREAGAKRPRLSAEDKAQRDQAKEAERLAQKASRDEARAQKKQLKDADRKPAHMSKVDKAAARLPALFGNAQEIFNDVTSNLGRDQVAALASHLVHFNRVKATERALGQKISTGDSVKIIGGSDTRYIGQSGTVSKSQRIRCYVDVVGAKKPIYLFTSDVELVSAAAKKVAANS
jgi:membrane protein involved in colicin uptake